METALDRAITLLTDGKPVDWEGVLEVTWVDGPGVSGVSSQSFVIQP